MRGVATELKAYTNHLVAATSIRMQIMPCDVSGNHDSHPSFVCSPSGIMVFISFAILVALVIGL